MSIPTPDMSKIQLFTCINSASGVAKDINKYSKNVKVTSEKNWFRWLTKSGRAQIRQEKLVVKELSHLKRRFVDELNQVDKRLQIIKVNDGKLSPEELQEFEKYGAKLETISTAVVALKNLNGDKSIQGLEQQLDKIKRDFAALSYRDSRQLERPLAPRPSYPPPPPPNQPPVLPKVPPNIPLSRKEEFAQQAKAHNKSEALVDNETKEFIDTDRRFLENAQKSAMLWGKIADHFDNDLERDEFARGVSDKVQLATTEMTKISSKLRIFEKMPPFQRQAAIANLIKSDEFTEYFKAISEVAGTMDALRKTENAKYKAYAKELGGDAELIAFGQRMAKFSEFAKKWQRSYPALTPQVEALLQISEIKARFAQLQDKKLPEVDRSIAEKELVRSMLKTDYEFNKSELNVFHNAFKDNYNDLYKEAFALVDNALAKLPICPEKDIKTHRDTLIAQRHLLEKFNDLSEMVLTKQPEALQTETKRKIEEMDKLLIAK